MIPPQSHPLDAHHVWQEVYQYSRRNFEQIEDYDERDSQLTASAAMLGWWTESGRPRATRAPIKMPRLGPLAEIADLKAVWCADRDGAVLMTKFGGWALCWSPKLQACAAFPRPIRRVQSTQAPPVIDRVLKTWARGRGVRWAHVSALPEPLMTPGLPLLAIEYESDKFTHGDPRRYIHHCEPGVVWRVAVSKTRGEPSAAMARGGNLHLTASGLEG